MYKLLLTSRYLRRKLIPIFALLAVMLCTAMVIIVISVMGGFLDMVKTAGRTLMGDVSVASAGLEGFAHYQELIDAVAKLPEAAAATPVIRAYGLIKIGPSIKGVEVLGIDGAGVGRVTDYRDTLVWDAALAARYPSVQAFYLGGDPRDAGVSMIVPGEADAPTAERTPAIVLGLEISPHNYRNSDGSYDYLLPMPGKMVTLTIMPVTGGGGLTEPSTDIFAVVNELKSGVWDVDSKRVYIPFALAQKMMLMSEADQVDPDTFEVIGKQPARATEVHVRAAEGVSAETLRQRVRDIYIELAERHPELRRGNVSIATWEQRQADFLRAVQNERGLVGFLFGIISVVAVVMVGVIFHMIVMEKTRDIGVLRALGASQGGIMSIFLVYGAVIGLLGASLGSGVAFLVVHYINEVHAWLGDGLGAAVLHAGTPLGGMIGFALAALVWVCIDSVFHRSRPLIVAVMAATGFVVALLVGVAMLVVKAMYLDVDESITLGTFANRLLVVPVAAAAAMGALGVLYWPLHRVVRRSTRRRIALMGLIGLLVGLAAVLVWRAAYPDIAQMANGRLSVQIWDRSVYFFDRIPNRLDWREVLLLATGFVFASVLGALVPAVKAAMVDPVESLRYE